DKLVTGVQTCALPIYELAARLVAGGRRLTLEHEGMEVGAGGVERGGVAGGARADYQDVTRIGHGSSLRSGRSALAGGALPSLLRSEERRVGKECRVRG